MAVHLLGAATLTPLFNKHQTSIFLQQPNKGICCSSDESEFEVDPDKAREALKKLDEQLLLQSPSPSSRKPPAVKVTVSRSDFEWEMKEKNGEVSASLVANSAIALLLFTLVYNVLFLTVIKPSIDGPDEAVMTTMTSESSVESQ